MILIKKQKKNKKKGVPNVSPDTDIVKQCQLNRCTCRGNIIYIGKLLFTLNYYLHREIVIYIGKLLFKSYSVN
jgi:hypothetical protein